MITQLQVENFKSWQETGEMAMAPLTGLFGKNSSGKTAILQLLLMWKQTVESVDRQRVLEIGGDRGTRVNLGRFKDIIHQHQLPGILSFRLDWKVPHPLEIADPQGKPQQILFSIPAVQFTTRILGIDNRISVEKLSYSFRANGNSYKFGMNCISEQAYDLIAQGYEIQRLPGQNWPLPPPVKSYAFPDRVNAYYQNASFLSQLVLAFEELFSRIYYLGPLRDYPRRNYLWTGEPPEDVGQRGELAISALLASRSREKISTIERRVSLWLRELGLIYDFRLQAIGEEYQVRVKRTAQASEVLITDVGFGVSQILPVLVLCYYAPVGSIIILEQPEIHLHPAVQVGLADVLIDAINTRKVQIILESHSEHLLRRLQRRVAEQQLAHEQAALYFCQTDREGRSQLTPLQLDRFGNISNWPEGFFGDELGELAAMTEAATIRQMAAQVS